MRNMRVLLIGFMSIILSGCASYSGNSISDSSDPLESSKLPPVFVMNDTIDSLLFKPLAKGYNALTPEPVKSGVTNFFSNLSEIDNAINNLLQGKPKQFATSVGRLTINSTIGIGGVFDVASYMGLTHAPEDFGQTIGSLGVDSGPYVILPIIRI